jgi:hypothetical protein
MTLHRIANELVTEACKHKCSVIAFEDLTEYSGTYWRVVGTQGAFNCLYYSVEYKPTG